MKERKELRTVLTEVLVPWRELLCRSLAYTFLWGLAAHGYMLMSSSISHDSLDEFLAVELVTAKKIVAGRIFVPAVIFCGGGYLHLGFWG